MQELILAVIESFILLYVGIESIQEHAWSVSSLNNFSGSILSFVWALEVKLREKSRKNNVFSFYNWFLVG